MNFGENVFQFYKNLESPKQLPNSVEVLYPYHSREVIEVVKNFYHTFMNDNRKRTFLIGINAGRFGGGVTGIPFTDPIRLSSELNIKNTFDKKPELSSNFIYKMIQHLGGTVSFYQQFYVTSTSPIGFVMNNKNLNYYDIKALQNDLEPYIVKHLRKQIEFGAKPLAYSLGKGKNIKFLNYLNNKYKLFQKIESLPHPRWIMQYKLKKIDYYLNYYKKKLIIEA